jgi:phosphate transport system permease protein
MSPTTQQVTAGLARRYAAEKRFRFYGMFAIAATLSFLAVLLISIVSKGLPAFTQTYMQLDVPLELSTLGIDQQTVDGVLDGSISAQTIRRANYNGAIREAMRERFPEVEGRSALRDLFKLVSKGAEFELAERVMEDPSVLGNRLTLWVPSDDEIGALYKQGADLTAPDTLITRLEDQSIAWGAELAAAGELDVRFNTTFFKNGDSREPELAGIRAALVGSAYTLLITFLLSFPVAVAAAIYLEEFAPKNRWTDLVEVNINNLAAVPSIVFGLLGLAVFINFFHLPRSAPLLGGIVLSLMSCRWPCPAS